MKTQILTYGDLFCGPGGMALGAKNTKVISKDVLYKIKPVWAIDSDYSSCQTFKKNIIPHNSEIISGSQINKGSNSDKNIIVNDIIENINIKYLPKIDILGFGFPCNDFSIMGEKKGVDGKYGSLYEYAVDALNILKPTIFVAENVTGLGSKGQRETMIKIMHELKKADNGYNITLHHYHLEDYGIPQTRHRFFIVGYKDKTKKFLVPEPSYQIVNASMAIDDGFVYNEGPISHVAFNHEITYPNEIVSMRLLQTKPGENAWNPNIDFKYRLNGVKNATFSNIYKKLDPDKPSYTVTGSGGGGTSMYHWNMEKGKQRALTNREKARLQTFPDTFRFYGTKTEIRRQVGMAVPVRASEIIFKATLRSYLGVSYKSIDENGRRYTVFTEPIFKI